MVSRRWVSSICFSLFIMVMGIPISSNLSLSRSIYLKYHLPTLISPKKTEVRSWMVNIRRKIHENSGLGSKDVDLSELVRAQLDELGVSYKYPVAKNGIIGYIGTESSPVVALRADMDALPIQNLLPQESVEWEHKSKVPGKMHACGNDAHVAMLLGAAKILQEHRDQLQGTVVLVFQPAEEGVGGAKEILDSSEMDNVEAIFGLHGSSGYPIGAVASGSGPVLVASGYFEAVITGKGGHAALPQHTIDPILAGSNVIVSLQHLISQEADPLDSQVVTVGKFIGGGAFNVIPDSVSIGGTFHAFSNESFFQLKQRIEEVIIRQASVQRCNATVTFNEEEKPFYPVTVNNKELHEHFQKVASNMIGSENIYKISSVMRAEDFAFYSDAIPGYFFYTGMKNETEGELEAGHSPYFVVNEDVLPYGAALNAALAARYLPRKKPSTMNFDRARIGCVMK